MSSSAECPPAVRALRALAVPLAAALLATLGLGGCAIARTVRKIDDTVHANSSVINLFTAKLTSGQPSSFEVTYLTTGSSPSKVVYAVRPPSQLAFTDTQAGTGGSASASPGNFRFIVNSGGEYACTLSGSGPAASASAPAVSASAASGSAPAASAPVLSASAPAVSASPASGSGASGSGTSASGGSGTSGWSCEKLPKSGASAEKTLLNFYTPAHWVTFLRDFSLAAGFAGDKISSSSRTVNGFAMQCVDFVASGVKGTSRICTTSQHLLGYVQVASDSTGFEITSYSPSPAAGLFQLPAGAKVTTPKSTS
jgi:hypothetical protein